MARLFNGTTDSLETASAPVTAVPLTIVAWANPTSAVGRSIVSIGDSATSSRFMLFMNTTGVQAAAIDPGGTNAASNGTTPLPTNQWTHCAAVFASNTSRTAYFNGAAATPNTTSSIPSGLNRLNIGARYAGGIGGFFPGAIAEVAVWNTALTADEIAGHAAGVSADQIRPGNLVYYADLIRDIRDLRGGLLISGLGTGTTFFDHPRIFL